MKYAGLKSEAPGLWSGWAGWLIALCLALLTACSDSPSPAQISVQPSDTAVVAGQAATLSVTASGEGLTYQWQSSRDGGTTWNNVAGATQASYTTPRTTAADNGTLFRVVVSGGGTTVTSSPVRLTVAAATVAPGITVQPAAQAVNAPDAVTFSVTASGTTPTYQWQRSTDGGNTWVAIAGATAASYTTGPTTTAMDGERYRVVVANSAGTLTSAAVTLTVNPTPAAAAISVQPANQAATAGSAAIFSVSVTGQPAPTLQWQRSTNGSTWTDIPGANGASYNTGPVALSQNGELFRVVATNASGSVTSSPATLTVTPAAAAPVITTQPAAQNVVAPATATFSAAASGVPTPAWQWQVSTDGGTTFSNIVGATSATYTTPATSAADDGKRYRVVASNASGTATSAAAPLSVTNVVASLYEGFAYPTSETLNGKNGGTGWSGPWTVTDGSGTALPDASSGFIVTGLSYTDAAGNALVVSGGAWQTNASVFFGQARRASTAAIGAAGTTRWISFLVKQVAPATGIDYAAAAPGTGYSFGSPAIAGGIGNGSAFVNCFYCQGGGSNAAIAGWGPGSVAMVLLKVEFAASGNDTMSLWINPPLTGALPAPTVVGNQADFGDVLSGLTLAWGDNRSFVFDELRLGESREAVGVYIPPSTGNSAFYVDFESPLPAQLNAGDATVTGVQGFAGLGPTGNTFAGSFLRGQTGNVVTITLDNLPPHQWLTLDFLFAAIDSLDGTGSYPAGDFFRITVDGVDFFRESFANASTSQIQSYVPPPGVELARRVDLGFSGPGGFMTDSAYWMGGDPIFQRIPHTASTVTITLRLEGTPQGLGDESWAIDNLRIIVGP
jgi:hypothetical protein